MSPGVEYAIMAFMSSSLCAREEVEKHTMATVSKAKVSLFIKIVLVDHKIRKIVKCAIIIVKPLNKGAYLSLNMRIESLLTAVTTNSPPVADWSKVMSLTSP